MDRNLWRNTNQKNPPQIWQKRLSSNIDNCKGCCIIFSLSEVTNEETVSETEKGRQLFTYKASLYTINGVHSASQDDTPEQYNRSKV